MDKQNNKIFDKVANILHVEDNPIDALLVKEVLLYDLQSYNYSITEVETLKLALNKLSIAKYDLILLDLSLEDSWGLINIETVKKFCNQSPIIVLTGSEDYFTAFNAIERGAQDCFIKNQAHNQNFKESIKRLLH